MEIQFLGTGSGSPSKNRNVTGITLKLLDEINEIWLFDCGEATQHMILNTTIRPRKIRRVFITHMHGDHIYGLPGFLSSRSFQGNDEVEPLTIYGPRGIKQYVEMSIKASYSKLAYPIEFVEFEEEGILLDLPKFSVTLAKLDHGVPSYGFRIEEKDQVGELQADKLKALGVPTGPLYGRLKKGESIQLEDGRIIHGKDFISEPIKGRKVAIFGDTRACPAELLLAKDCDVVVHEATFEASEQAMARRYYHSTTADATQLAKKANVKQLLLTHISARYVGAKLHELEREARQLYEHTVVVKDYGIFDIPKKK